MKKVEILRLCLLIFFLICIIAVLTTEIFLSRQNSPVNSGKTDTTKNKENYTVNISRPEAIDINLSKLLDKIIAIKKENFENLLRESDNTQKYALNIDSRITDNGNNLYSVHLIVFEDLGEKDKIREDSIYYYDYKNNKEVTLNDIFVDEKESFGVLSSLVKEKLSLEYGEETNYEKIINQELKPLKELLSLIVFDKENVTLILPAEKPENFDSGIAVSLDYKDLNDILKETYKKKEDTEPQPGETTSPPTPTETLPTEPPATSTQPDPSAPPSTEASPDTSVPPATSPPSTQPEAPAVEREKRDLSELKDKKLIALTFDDGPTSRLTAKLLDGLKERNARATFFFLGSRVKSMPDIVLKAYSEGHTVGSHTYSHLNLLNLSDSQIISEIASTSEEIKKITGVYPTFIRPPYGNFNQHITGLTDMTFILWNVDTLDWKTRNEQAVYDEIINKAKDGRIILLHDLYEISVNAALRAIDTLQQQGYAFVSVEELVEMGRVDTVSTRYMYSF